MSYEEIVDKWKKLIDSMPYGVDVEFEMSDSEAQIVMALLEDRGDTIFDCEIIGPRKTSYAN